MSEAKKIQDKVDKTLGNILNEERLIDSVVRNDDMGKRVISDYHMTLEEFVFLDAHCPSIVMNFKYNKDDEIFHGKPPKNWSEFEDFIKKNSNNVELVFTTINYTDGTNYQHVFLLKRRWRTGEDFKNKETNKND